MWSVLKYWSFPGDPNEPTLHRNPMNGLLRATVVVILDTGHHFTSYPTDIQILDKYKKVKCKNLSIFLLKLHSCKNCKIILILTARKRSYIECTLLRSKFLAGNMSKHSENIWYKVKGQSQNIHSCCCSLLKGIDELA